MTAGQTGPRVSLVAPAMHRVTGEVTNFYLVGEGNGSRWSTPGTRGTGTAAAGLVRPGRRRAGSAGGRAAHARPR